MPTTNRRPGRPTQAEAEALTEQLREAALATFLECGYDGASMEAIARAAGITKQTLYSRYGDKRAVFADVIPWAMSRHETDGAFNTAENDDLTEALTSIGRKALARATDPRLVRLQQIAMNESSRFPEFSISAETMMWSARLRAVVELLDRHCTAGDIEIDPDEMELAAEHFLAMVEAIPMRLAEFGVFRSNKQGERHLQYAVKLFLRAVAPSGGARHKRSAATASSTKTPRGSNRRSATATTKPVRSSRPGA